MATKGASAISNAVRNFHLIEIILFTRWSYLPELTSVVEMFVL
jgi:hypothetical protein